MNWEMLDQLLKAVDGVPRLDRADPSMVLRDLEERADRSPADRVLASAIRALDGTLRTGELRGSERGGVRRESLLAWDPWTLTWLGTDLETGGEAVLRELRAASSPVRTRALARDAQALRFLVSDLRSGEGWLAAPLPGELLPAHPSDDPEVVARLMGTALEELGRFERTGLWPVTAPEQWRWTTLGVRVVALDLTHPTDPGPVIAGLARFLAPRDERDDNPVFELLHALAQAPPRTVADGAEALERALATDLAARRHDLFARRRDTARADRVARLLDAMERLRAAVPPPTGRCAIGIDLDGQTLVAETRPDGLWWGPASALERIWSPDDGFDAPAARRLLRARASAPPSERLNNEVGGDASLTDAIGRWVASALKARTVRLLLEKELAARAD